MSKSADFARTCIAKLSDEEGCDMVWLDMLKECLKAGVSCESLGITKNQVELWETEICLKHVKLWDQVIDPKHPDSEMVKHRQHWLSQVPQTYVEVQQCASTGNLKVPKPGQMT
jgi:hypothetical protein